MSALVTPSIALLRPYQAGKPIEELARERGITDAVKLASNENPHGPSPLAIEAMRRVVGDAHRYPDANAVRLRERLAQTLGVSMPEVVQGNGSNELLDCWCVPSRRPPITSCSRSLRSSFTGSRPWRTAWTSPPCR